MIPRRRIRIDAADLTDLLRTIWRRGERARADVAAFEKAAAAYLGSPHVFATASGRDALDLILDGLGVGAGDELIVPAYTLGELLPRIRARGIVPVPADIDPATLNLTVASVAARVSPRTRAIFAAHLFGTPCDIRGLCAFAQEHGLAVIEDCAHAFGARVDGRPVGTFGSAALFSLEVNKPVATFGGGLLVTRDAALAAFAQAALRARPSGESTAVRKAIAKIGEELLVRSPLYGPLARLLFSPRVRARFERFYRRAHDRLRAGPVAYSGFQARLGSRRLARLDARNEAANAQRERLAATLAGPLSRVVRDRDGEPCFYNLVVRYGGAADTLRERGRRLGIDIAVGSEVMDDVAALLGHDDCPNAAAALREIFQLPCYEELSAAREARLAAALRTLASPA